MVVAPAVRYEGVVKVFLDADSDQTDEGRIVRSQAEYLTSSVVPEPDRRPHPGPADP